MSSASHLRDFDLTGPASSQSSILGDRRLFFAGNNEIEFANQLDDEIGERILVDSPIK